MAEFGPATRVIGGKAGDRLKGLKAQMWMARPGQGKGRCTFELMSKKENTTTIEDVALRERLAASIRKHLVQAGLPDGVKEASQSTIVRISLSLPRIQGESSDTSDNAKCHANEIAKVVFLFRFLNVQLREWIKKQQLD
jgi:hypothetical protein